MKRWAVALMALLLASPILAQLHPNHDRGFSADKAFQIGQIDHVNLFNGKLTMTIPIGQRYPVSSHLSYGLTLTYSSNLWDYEEVTNCGNGAGQPNCYRSVSGKHFNAGLGWAVSLGRLLSPTHADNDSPNWLYVSPDGAQHAFHNTLHIGDPEDPGDSGTTYLTQTVLYTRDGSYLRLNVDVDAQGRDEIEFPSGEVHRFLGGGDPDQMRDRFGNSVSISYPFNRWVLTDSQGRVQTIQFQTNLLQNWKVIDYIDLTNFSGGTARYDFDYTQPATGLPDACQDMYQPQNQNGTQVLLLTRLTLPDGSAYEMPISDYQLTRGVCEAGHLRRLRLPTWGQLAWTYGNWEFPSASVIDPDLPNSEVLDLSRNDGVLTRQLIEPDGTVHGTWTYAQSWSSTTNRYETKTTVTDPLGHRVEHFFATPWSDSQNPFPAGWSKADYGLPFTRRSSVAGKYLSRRVIAAGTSGSRRTTYLRYEADQLGAVSHPPKIQRNQRLAGERSVYNDDGNRFSEIDHSRFDGLGHYRKTVTGGSFNSANQRITERGYNRPRGIYEIDPVTDQPSSKHTFSMLPASDLWVLGTYDLVEATENGSTVTQDVCYSGTGFLRGIRQRQSSGARGPNDTLVRFTNHYGTGQPKYERYYGGDLQSLPPGEPCPATPLATPAYEILHTYSAGVRNSSQYTGVTHLQPDLDIDASTGLAKKSRDIAGLATSYTYDVLGRLTEQEPASGHDVRTQIFYDRATSASNLARVVVERRPPGAGTELARQRYSFDGFGRVTQEETRMPGTTWMATHTTYDALGHVTTRSNPGTSTHFTSYLDFDPWGRPKTIRPPEGQSHNVDLSYQGVRIVHRTVRVASGASGTEEPVTTQEEYDRQGRLYKVTEDSNGTPLETEYTYDPADRLTRVQMTRGGTTQNRFFNYDGRGFLTSEIHPEKRVLSGLPDDGKVSYSNFDARGNVGRKKDGPFDLSYSYDKAERLTQVRETGGDPLKLFSYATQSIGNDWAKGKLRTATRYNYVDLGSPGSPSLHSGQVQETYTYAGRQGRVSDKRTDWFIDSWRLQTFDQSFSHDPLGNPESLSYPSCSASCGVGTPRTVSYTYAFARLSDIDGYAAFTYHSNGAPWQILHTNGVTESIAKDPHHYLRPARIRTFNATVGNWDTINYAYDGAGNVQAMGNHTFRYDRYGRLVEAVQSDGRFSNGTQHTRTFAYDGFGNLTAVTKKVGTANATTQNLPANPSTNRLTSAAYDDAGNLTAWSGATFVYDAFGMVQRTTNGTEDWAYAYTADDERFFAYRVNAPNVRENYYWLRDLNGQLLREFSEKDDAPIVWTLERDYIRRPGGGLIAAETPQGRRHFHPDHLGTPRLITDGVGAMQAYHAYSPYGEELTSISQDGERLKFTSHERDLMNPAGTGDDLDYMHARYYKPLLGRFLSFDPVGGTTQDPHSWNRYAYVLGNPMILIDPEGLAAINSCSEGGSGSVSCTGDITVVDSGTDDGIDFTLTTSQLRFLLNDPDAARRQHRLVDLGYGYGGARLSDALANAPGEPCTNGYTCDILSSFSDELPVIEAMETGVALAAGIGVGGMAAGELIAGSALSQFTVRDFIRYGPTVVSNQLVQGAGAVGATVTRGIKGGGLNRLTGARLPIHYHVHRYNWYKPWLWFRNTPIIKPKK